LLPLSHGKFLAVQGGPFSRGICIITPGEQFSFERIGDLPGKGKMMCR